MEKLVVSCMKSAMILVGAAFFVVCFAGSAEAQCGDYLFDENPDISGFKNCSETVYGPPTETEMYLLTYIQSNPTDIFQALAEGPFSTWSWQDFYGCMSQWTATAAVGSWVLLGAGVALAPEGFVAGAAGALFNCAIEEINWFW